MHWIINIWDVYVQYGDDLCDMYEVLSLAVGQNKWKHYTHTTPPDKGEKEINFNNILPAL